MGLLRLRGQGAGLFVTTIAVGVVFFFFFLSVVSYWWGKEGGCEVERTCAGIHVFG